MRKPWLMLVLGALWVPGIVAADDDRKGPDVAPATDARYLKECGSCHFAFQPGLLPARSWTRLMGGLADHFGDNAELPKEDVAAITEYLTKHAADRSDYRRSRRLAGSVDPRETPLRITQLPYFAREHRKLTDKLVAQNPRVKSLSNCSACHTKAAQGSYREREIEIPGYGRWDD